jgi:prolyl 4-hydroxylase
MNTSLKEHSVNLLDNFICGYIINDIKLCDEIIEFHKNSPMKYAGLSGGGVNPSVKKSTDLELNLDEPLYQRYVKNLQKCLDLYVAKYRQVEDTVRFADFETINIQHYQASEAYFGWHAERSGINAMNNRRHLVFMTYLNDVDDEGETEFMYQKNKIKPQKGLTLIWTVDWPFTHRGIASQTQEKYIVTGWLSFAQEN